jgi:hypothetical protein
MYPAFYHLEEIAMDREAVLEFYRRVVAKYEDIKVKGAKTSYTAINGNMFSFIDDQARICLRFSEERKAELNEIYGTTDVLQYGAVMRGYVPLSSEVTIDETTLEKLFSESFEFAKNLKPKATKKSSK